MANIIVKKDTVLVNAAYTLTLAEQRLILLAIVEAEGQADELKEMSVHASAYADRYKVSSSAAYKALHEATRQLFERRFSYNQINKRGNLEQVVSRWVERVKYIEDEGTVHLRFATDVIPLLSNLQKRFTYYGLEQIAGLTSVHAVRLYELLIAWRTTGKTPVLEIEDFRRRLGVEPGEYPRMSNFKARVLDMALQQINERTDMVARYEQHKSGRTITGFSFTFILKERDGDRANVDSLADWREAKEAKRKRKVITKREAELMSHPGEDYPELYQRLSPTYIIKA